MLTLHIEAAGSGREGGQEGAADCICTSWLAQRIVQQVPDVLGSLSGRVRMMLSDMLTTCMPQCGPHAMDMLYSDAYMP